MNLTSQSAFRHSIKESFITLVRKLRLKEHIEYGNRGAFNFEQILTDSKTSHVFDSEETPHDELIVLSVSLVDKFNTKRFYVIEETQIEIRALAEDVNGFEFLCHPSLENDENLAVYFENWIRSIMKSFFALLGTLPVNGKFLNPNSNKEKHSASSMKARYKLALDIKRQDL